MTKFFIKYAIFFLLTMPAQAIIFNHAILFNVAVPLVFIWLIIMLPVTVGVNLSVTLGFFAGFLLDIFSDTPGVNALCCTVLAFARKPILHLYVSMDDDLAGRSPSAQSMGHGPVYEVSLNHGAPLLHYGIHSGGIPSSSASGCWCSAFWHRRHTHLCCSMRSTA